MGTILHCSVDVQGALLADYQQQRRVYMTLSKDGRACRSVREYREVLAELLGQGIKRLPLGEPCEGFSYQTGCPGHPQEAAGGQGVEEPLEPLTPISPRYDGERQDGAPVWRRA